MPDIILKNILGQDVTYSGIDTVKLKNTAGGEETFSHGIAVENVPIELDLVNGETQTIYAPEGALVKSAVVSITGGGGGNSVEMEETELPFTAADGAYQAMLPITRLFLNATYIVIWNGIEYSCTCKAMEFADSLVLTVGNAAFLGGEAEDAPFLIVQTPDIVGCITLEANATNTVGLTLNFEAGGSGGISGVGLLSPGGTYEINDENVTDIRAYAMGSSDSSYGDTGLTAVNLPNVITINTNAFRYCKALKTVIMPKLTTVNGGGVFYYCTALETVDMPLVTKIPQFSYCSALKNVNFPKATTCYDTNSFERCTGLVKICLPSLTTVRDYTFQNCSSLQMVDLPVCTKIGDSSYYYAFRNCSALKALILRSATMCTLNSSQHLTGSSIASSTGYIYVPSNLLNSYKSASQWSSYSSRFRAIESYTIDGTVTGELDTSKI